MHVMDNHTKWEDYLHLAEFAYNNGYQTSTKLSPFEIMYGRKCKTPVSCGNQINTIMIRSYIKINGRRIQQS